MRTSGWLAGKPCPLVIHLAVTEQLLVYGRVPSMISDLIATGLADIEAVSYGGAPPASNLTARIMAKFPGAIM